MEPETLQMIEQWANDILVWVGFGTIVGLLAKGIMPGRDPGGAVATLCMGVGGTVIGCGVFAYFSGSTERITPISPLGFVVATGGAFVLLFFYRLLGGISSSKAMYRGVDVDPITPETAAVSRLTKIDATFGNPRVAVHRVVRTFSLLALVRSPNSAITAAHRNAL